MKAPASDSLAPSPVDTLPTFVLPTDPKRRRTPIHLDPNCDRIMRRPEVQLTTGLSRASQYRLIARRDFPPPIRLSANTVGWLRSEVEAWIASRVAASREGSPSTRAKATGV